MHRTITLILLFAIAVLVIGTLNSNSGGRATLLNQDNTGAPGAAGTCQGCHNSSTIQSTVTLQVLDDTNTPVTSYIPEAEYSVRVTVNAAVGTPNVYGFQAVALRTTGNTPVNTWSNPGANVQFKTINSSGRMFAEQRNASASNTFNMKWTAPAAGSGSVRFFVSANAGNGNGMSSGDGGSSSNITLTESPSTSLTDTDNQQSTLLIAQTPQGNTLYIHAPSDVAHGNWELKLIALNGQSHLAHHTILNAGTLVAVPLPQLPAGLYVAQVVVGQRTYAQPIVLP